MNITARDAKIILQSMTKEELKDLSIIDQSRKERIAKGSSRPLEMVECAIRLFYEASAKTYVDIVQEYWKAAQKVISLERKIELEAQRKISPRKKIKK